MKILLLIFCVVVGFTSCKKTTMTIESATPENTGAPVATNLNNNLLLKLVNDKRTSGCNCGTTIMPPVSPLTWNNALAAAALSHSKDMNANNYFDHNSQNGKTPGDRIIAAGYKWTTYGENIAAGQPTEQIVFDAWINSEGHCKNIMNANFKEMGIAKDGKYWTQDFGRQ